MLAVATDYASDLQETSTQKSERRDNMINDLASHLSAVLYSCEKGFVRGLEVHGVSAQREKTTADHAMSRCTTDSHTARNAV